MDTSNTPSPGSLYIVATPIGNLEDITLRAIRILRGVDLIAAEDTRHTKKLLNHLGIGTPLISDLRNAGRNDQEALIEKLQAGAAIALVSDAGTPAVSDPGAVLVKLAHDAGIPIVPIPGPSALTAAISCSGFADAGFLFLGFAPTKAGQRRKLLASLVHSEYPVVFYEAPRRVRALLGDALEILGDREILWARELTKSFEEVRRTRLASLMATIDSEESRGEFVIIIGPGTGEQATGDDVEELLIWYRDNSELSMKDVCRKLAKDLGLSRSQIYQQALAIWKIGPSPDIHP